MFQSLFQKSHDKVLYTRKSQLVRTETINRKLEVGVSIRLVVTSIVLKFDVDDFVQRAFRAGGDVDVDAIKVNGENKRVTVKTQVKKDHN